MKLPKSNIILIGMPGSGKSTVGVILAKMLAKSFIDTDILVQNSSNRTLQDIVDKDGYETLLAIEERVLLNINCLNHIISTGGSAIYSKSAMYHLKQIGVIVFLHADLCALTTRVQNYETRGIAKKPHQSLQDLFNERLVLYEHYADLTILSSKTTQDQVCSAIIHELGKIQQ